MNEAAGLYVHIPFCSAICPYCDFAVSVGRPEKRRDYVEALKQEIVLSGDLGYGAFDTLYFGGGTPSILTPEQLREIVDTARAAFDFADDTHLYLEANPEDVTAENLEAWRRLGVSMLSLGVQSFDDAELAFLGRRHTAADARRAVTAALGAGLDTVSVDLIYALPGQTLDAWRRCLREAVALEPQHLSCYELEVHERTTFGKRHARGELRPLDGDLQGDLLAETFAVLDAAGLTGYEVSNFARAPAHRSRHNLKYWRHVPYLGVGVGAHSFDGERRSWNERSVLRYLRRTTAGELARAGEETLDASARAVEALMLGLRQRDGVDLASFKDVHGVDVLAVNRSRIDAWCREGLVELDGERLRPTVRGLAVADGLAASLDASLSQASRSGFGH